MIYPRLFKFMLLLFAIGSILALFPSTSVDSARANQQIDIHPAKPSFSHPFFVSVVGQWTDSCVPAFESLTVADEIMQLVAKTPGPSVDCTEIETEWEFSVLVPAQQPNVYLAEILILSGVNHDVIATAEYEFHVIGGIQVDPGLPFATESIVLRLADLSLDTCVPQLISHQVVSNTVTIETHIPEGACGQALTPWQIETTLESLVAGGYQAEMFVTDHRPTPPQRSLLLTGSFVVADQIFHLFLPKLGCTGPIDRSMACLPVHKTSRYEEFQ